MREDADDNHIHEHVLVQDEMNEVGHWVPQPGLHGLARVPISAMLRLKGGSQDEGGRRRQPHPRTRAGVGRDGGIGHWVTQPGLHGPARFQISAMLRLKVMRSPVN